MIGNGRLVFCGLSKALCGNELIDELDAHMTKQFIIRIFLGIIFAGNVLLSVSCHDSVEPNNIQILYIENGFYDDVLFAEPSEIKCAVQFDYFITGQPCQVGGYLIRYDSTHSGTIDWYMMQTLTPEVRYAMRDTFRLSNELTTNPTVTMQGYRIGDSQSYPELKAQYVLVPKTW